MPARPGLGSLRHAAAGLKGMGPLHSVRTLWTGKSGPDKWWVSAAQLSAGSVALSELLAGEREMHMTVSAGTGAAAGAHALPSPAGDGLRAITWTSQDSGGSKGSAAHSSLHPCWRQTCCWGLAPCLSATSGPGQRLVLSPTLPPPAPPHRHQPSTAKRPAGPLDPALMLAGVGATLARDVPFSAIYWGSLEPIRRSLLPSDQGATAGQILAANCCAGGLGGAAAAAITTPLVPPVQQLQAGQHPLSACCHKGLHVVLGCRFTWTRRPMSSCPGRACRLQSGRTTGPGPAQPVPCGQLRGCMGTACCLRCTWWPARVCAPP